MIVGCSIQGKSGSRLAFFWSQRRVLLVDKVADALRLGGVVCMAEGAPRPLYRVDGERACAAPACWTRKVAGPHFVVFALVGAAAMFAAAALLLLVGHMSSTEK